jgi:hypothetical protein
MKNEIKAMVKNLIKKIPGAQKMVSTAKGLIKASIKTSTSISDNYVYPDFCLKASTNMRVFSSFRRNNTYKAILEHVNANQGQEYLNEINKDPELLKHIDEFKKNDEFGGAELIQYENTGGISPSTLRYIKILSDLKNLFGNLDDMDICEVGVGYGGQCRIVHGLYTPKKYTLVDITPALMLTGRYLDNFILNVVDYKTMNELEIADYDLVISNYAFTELPRPIQDVYLQKVILNSKRGYITYNEISPADFHSYTKDELLKIIPNSKIIAEVPLTHPKNCIIVWGNIT